MTFLFASIQTTMTAAHERLYLRTLHELATASITFCVIGSFGLRLQHPDVERRWVADCDVQLPPRPLANLAQLVRVLQAGGWRVALWEQPVRLPLRAANLAGKYYLRARQGGAVLDCSYENDYWSWAEFAASTRQQAGLPVLAVEAILRQKGLCGRATDRALLARLGAAAGLA